MISPGGMAYVSYSHTITVADKVYFLIGPDRWMTAVDLEPVIYSSFKGIYLQSNVPDQFAWVIQDSTSIIYDENSGGRIPGSHYDRYQVVQILSSTSRDEGLLEHYEIAPGEWLHDDSLSVFSIEETPPHGVRNCRWIRVNLKEQNLAVYEDCKLVFATLVSTGLNSAWTASGEYICTRS